MIWHPCHRVCWSPLRATRGCPSYGQFKGPNCLASGTIYLFFLWVPLWPVSGFRCQFALLHFWAFLRIGNLRLRPLRKHCLNFATVMNEAVGTRAEHSSNVNLMQSFGVFWKLRGASIKSGSTLRSLSSKSKSVLLHSPNPSLLVEDEVVSKTE